VVSTLLWGSPPACDPSRGMGRPRRLGWCRVAVPMMTNGAPIRYLMAAAARPRDRYSHRLAKSFSANIRSTSENDRASGTPFGDVPGRREAVCRRHSICGGAARRSGFSGAVD
jgi:hypothetical protein